MKWKRFPWLCHNIKWVPGLVSKLWRYVFECWGLWLCDSADNIMSTKLNMAGMWPWVPKRLLKWKKAKNILFYSKLILSTFCEKVNFLTARARSCCRCGQFDIGIIFVLHDLQHLLISLARQGFIIFLPCWTTLPTWRVSNKLDLP